MVAERRVVDTNTSTQIYVIYKKLSEKSSRSEGKIVGKIEIFVVKKQILT